MSHKTIEHETKVFNNGNSQAVRIPKEFQLQEKCVFIRKNEDGDLVISTQSTKWNNFFSLLQKNQDELNDFMGDREDPVPEERNLFE